MIVTKTQEKLLALAEEDYQQFSAKLSPGIENILGVRLPQLRRLAKEMLQEDWRSYLAAEPYYFEERMLQGMIIGVAKIPVEERLEWIARFVPRINSWSVCDSFCTGLKFANKHKGQVWAFLQPYLHSQQEYQLRFAVIMLLDYYLDEPTYLEQILEAVDQIDHEGYYVKMAVAWLLATALAKQPQQIWPYLKQQQLDAFTYQKTLQKAIESRRISPEEKEILRQMKREMQITRM